jgi:hypothetical protein
MGRLRIPNWKYRDGGDARVGMLLMVAISEEGMLKGCSGVWGVSCELKGVEEHEWRGEGVQHSTRIRNGRF